MKKREEKYFSKILSVLHSDTHNIIKEAAA
jgi:hypothetical protein